VSSADSDYSNYKYKVGPAATTVCSSSTGYMTATLATDHITTDLTASADGDYRLCVLGFDTTGNQTAYASAIDKSWTKDTIAPTAILLNAPLEASTTTDSVLNINLDNASGGVVSYRYKLAVGTLADAPTVCANPTGFSGSEIPVATKITDNLDTYGQVVSFILCVIARDGAGNYQATPTILTWNKDTLAPVAIISGVPTSATNLLSLSFTVSANPISDISSYKYKIGIDGTVLCNDLTGYSASPIPVATSITADMTSLADGVYRVCVLGIDAYGNQQPAINATSAFWTKDTVAPIIALSMVPTGTLKNTTYAITVGSADTDFVYYNYKLGLASNTDCAVTTDYGNNTLKGNLLTFSLAASPDATYKICVRGYDIAGNASAIHTSTWTKDTFAPKATLAGAPTGTSKDTVLNITVSATVPSDITTYKYKVGLASSISCSINSGADTYSSAIDVNTPITSSLATLADGMIKVCVNRNG